MALWCTKTSSPVSRLMKPYPLSLLNHLTVPTSAISTSGLVRGLVAARNRAGRELCNVHALPFKTSPDQGAIHPDSLKSEALIEGDGRVIEVVHEERDRLSFSRAMPADLAQQRAGVAVAAEARIGPDAHQLHGLVRHG